MGRDQDLAEITSPDYATRLRAVLRLQSAPGHDARDALIHALYDDDTAIIDAAATALVHREDTEAINALVVALQLKDADAEIADHVAWVLREHEPTSQYAAEILRRVRDA